MLDNFNNIIRKFLEENSFQRIAEGGKSFAWSVTTRSSALKTFCRAKNIFSFSSFLVLWNRDIVSAIYIYIMISLKIIKG